MRLLNKLLIGVIVGLLSSCSLFTTIPPKVVDGQRGAYQGVILIDESIKTLLDVYEQDNKAAVTYHLNYVYQEKIQEVDSDSSLSGDEKTTKIAAIEAKRDSEIKDVFKKIEAKRQVLAQKMAPNIDATKRLLEAVYNYLSTTPITIDNVDFWIKRFTNGSNQN